MVVDEAADRVEWEEVDDLVDGEEVDTILSVFLNQLVWCMLESS